MQFKGSSPVVIDDLVLRDEFTSPLDEVMVFEGFVHWLAKRAHDLGLFATWSRIESLDDEVDAHIARMKRNRHV